MPRRPTHAPPPRRAAPPHLRRPRHLGQLAQTGAAACLRLRSTTLPHRTHIWAVVPDGLVLTGCPAMLGAGGAPSRPPNPPPESASLVRSHILRRTRGR